MSTVSMHGIHRFARVLPAGVGVLDAPVLGSLAEAEAGTLCIFVGGSAEVLDRTGPVLATLGTVHQVGELGAGTASKLVANSTLLGCLAVLGESLALADRLGLAQGDAFEVLAATPLAEQAARRRTSVESRSFPARFTLNLASKDAQLITSEAAGRGLGMRVASAVCEWLDDAQSSGLGEDDYTALLGRIISMSSGDRD
jgi:3-hydroxyisobutyrate dehydrogenase/2-hydroxy-3-oxopropionate reductase